MKLVQFISLLFTSLALAPAAAHLPGFPHKVGLTREAYLTVQQTYRGRARLGIVVAGALLSTLALGCPRATAEPEGRGSAGGGSDRAHYFSREWHAWDSPRAVGYARRLKRSG